MSPRAFLVGCLVVLAAGATLRGLWLRADPPVTNPVGIVWHDEGAWTHNARNKVIEGVWRTDDWNPIFVAPVFTALEYTAFQTFGVGTWQARLVPLGSGLAAIVALMWGLRAFAGRRVVVVAGALLATNYVFVMWNRAALMESTMTAFIVVSWAAYARASTKAAWGWLAGSAAVLAWFSKAAAAFYLGALVIDALIAFGVTPARRRASVLTLAGLTAIAAIIGLAFIVPHWSEYRFYNWQMTVLRKPDYSLHALVYRASGLPIGEGTLSRVWLVLVMAAIGIVGIVTRWKDAHPAERLLALWVLVGFAELMVHDSTNERRYVMFIPALVALAALWLGRAANADMTPPPSAQNTTRGDRIVGPAVVLVLCYIVAASLLRLGFLSDVLNGDYRLTVRLSAAIAVATAGLSWWRWDGVRRWLVTPRLPPFVGATIVMVAVVFNLYEYADWAAHRTELNYRASVALGQRLPPGTLVQGKLANGLSLENRIRPLFIGNGFGNYADRLRRDDARYILTYDLPRVGYESSDGSGLIQELLDHYPNHRVVATFDVEETPGADRAVLIAK